MIKTLTRGEAELLIKILPDYMLHLRQHPDTLINKIFGLHSMTLYEYNITLYFMVIENIFYAELDPQEKYDIKGSWVGRNTGRRVDEKKLMKDNDLRRKLILDFVVQTKLMKQLKLDTDFLCSWRIMDYSLLLGIYYLRLCPTEAIELDLSPATPKEIKFSKTSTDLLKSPPGRRFRRVKSEAGVSRASSLSSLSRAYRTASAHNCIKTYSGGVQAKVIEGPGIYYMGIIDILQEWNWSKWFERCLKTKVLNCCPGAEYPAEGVSCIPPEPYQNRFLGKMQNSIVTDTQFLLDNDIEPREMQENSFRVYPSADQIQKNMEKVMRSPAAREYMPPHPNWHMVSNPVDDQDALRIVLDIDDDQKESTDDPYTAIPDTERQDSLRTVANDPTSPLLTHEPAHTRIYSMSQASQVISDPIEEPPDRLHRNSSFGVDSP